MYIMPVWGWFLGLAIFFLSMLLVLRLRPQFFVREVFFPVTEFESELGFNDPAAKITVKYEENGIEKTVEMTVAQFKELVAGKEGEKLISDKRIAWVSGGIFCCISAAVSFYASYLFSNG